MTSGPSLSNNYSAELFSYLCLLKGVAKSVIVHCNSYIPLLDTAIDSISILSISSLKWPYTMHARSRLVRAHFECK